MITIRRAGDRGRTKVDWLDSRHTFSFGEYQDPTHMGFGALRVINDDRVAPGGGFGTHGHRDMEIITYVLDGALEHKDSLGTGSQIRPGEVQRMSAGTGIRHSEFNASKSAGVRFLQMWILPARTSLPPSYAQKAFAAEEMQGRLRLIAASDGRDGAVGLHQDADLYAARLAPGDTVSHPLRPGRISWLQVARGEVTLNGQSLAEGDGAAITDEKKLDLKADSAAEVLLFDLA